MTQSALAYDWIDNEQLIASTDLHTCRNARNNGSEEKSQRGSAVEGSQNRRLHTHQCTDSCKSIPQSIPTHHTTSESIPRASPEHPQSIPRASPEHPPWSLIPAMKIFSNIDVPHGLKSVSKDLKESWFATDRSQESLRILRGGIASSRIPKNPETRSKNKPNKTRSIDWIAIINQLLPPVGQQ